MLTVPQASALISHTIACVRNRWISYETCYALTLHCSDSVMDKYFQMLHSKMLLGREASLG